jgi:hypothetical protein
MKNRLVIYDFDGTLFDSPDREKGHRIYRAATNSDFPFQGWWGRPESLLPPIVPQEPDEKWFIKSTIQVYKNDAADENTSVILMTGRPVKMRQRVKQILDSQKLKFDAYFFSGQKNSKGTDTGEIKLNYILELLEPKYKTLELWEDRPSQIDFFIENLPKSCNLEKIIVHDAVKMINHQI